MKLFSSTAVFGHDVSLLKLFVWIRILRQVTYTVYVLRGIDFADDSTFEKYTVLVLEH